MAFASKPLLYNPPEDEMFEYMIHLLAEVYGQCIKHVGANYTEIDFWRMAAFKGLESANTKKK